MLCKNAELVSQFSNEQLFKTIVTVYKAMSHLFNRPLNVTEYQHYNRIVEARNRYKQMKKKLKTVPVRLDLNSTKIIISSETTSVDNSTSISKRAASLVSMAEGMLLDYEGAI